MLLYLLVACVLNLFITSASARTDGFPGGLCTAQNQHCVFEEDNIISIINQVTLDECRLLCNGDSSCRYISYYDKNGYPFTNSCILFTNCKVYEYFTDNYCTSCITEDTNCQSFHEPCTAPVSSHMSSNLINTFTGIQTEGNCRDLCLVEDNCNFFTYYSLQDRNYPGSCFLLSKLEEPIKPTFQYFDAFVTGTKDCPGNGGCFLMSAGKDTTQSAMMFSDIYDYDTKTNVVVVGTCSLTVVAVGGGGDGCDTCGGPGSGYLEWEQISVEGSLMLEVKVGGPGRETEVEIPYFWGGIGGNGGTKVLVAQGGTYEGGEGGNGFCGGGGDGRDGKGGGAGGFDGSNGHSGSSSSGGKGSGVKVSDIPVKGFQLSPGKGGKGTGEGGGGGGGLLVDGKGPVVINENDGEGYGAGDSIGEGKSGLVILDCN